MNTELVPLVIGAVVFVAACAAAVVVCRLEAERDLQLFNQRNEQPNPFREREPEVLSPEMRTSDLAHIRLGDWHAGVRRCARRPRQTDRVQRFRPRF